jgi:transcriptional regulator of acetoin/glycerol metabolism
MAQDFTQTADETAYSQAGLSERGEPGVVVVFSSGEPMCGVLPLGARGEKLSLAVGRGAIEGVDLRDTCMSRNHATISREGWTWTITDHGSHNGTYVDGQRVEGAVSGPNLRVVRTGETLFLLVPDHTPFASHGVEIRNGYVVGPRLDAVLQAALRAAQAGVLHITGETGSGKEEVARAFHRFGAGKAGPFVPVNCAAIPEGLAERLLFGARRGAYSGADRDATGYVQEASGGTLFLDEVGELDLAVQAKLLRVLEVQEVLPLGAARPVQVDLRFCSATHRDLRAAVAEGTFREDLFFRLGRPRVAIPPLRERPEEIPYLIEGQLRAVAAGLVAQAALVEACLLRPWPGNVRELLAELRDAAFTARAAGKSVVKLSHLPDGAGLPYAAPADAAPSVLPSREEIEAALSACDGRVATAARKLGVHRNQLRRWLDKNPDARTAPAELGPKAGR